MRSSTHLTSLTSPYDCDSDALDAVAILDGSVGPGAVDGRYVDFGHVVSMNAEGRSVRRWKMCTTDLLRLL